jgi:GNAT superfamily N-acetyltransferase
MAIVVEFLGLVSYQDQRDLQKIYRDAPDWLFTPFADASHLIESGLQEQVLIAVRFNDRLLGAARLLKGQTSWDLSHLCVRRVMRRRGIAHRLIDHAQKSARLAGCELRLLAAAEPPEVQALAAVFQLPLLPLITSEAGQGDA